MKYFFYLVYILVVALITMILIYIGYYKNTKLPLELTNELYLKSRDKVIKYLKKNETISAVEIRNLILDIKAKIFWSRKKAEISNPVQFTNYLIGKLLEEEKIIEETRGKSKLYKINPKNVK